MMEFVTMGQVEDAIEHYFAEHQAVMSFYSALIYLKQNGMTSLQCPESPDFSKWDLTDLQGLLSLFAHIPIPVMIQEDTIAEENAHRSFYEAGATIFKQPARMQTLDHPEHERQPSNSVRIIYILKGSCRVTLGKWSEMLQNESVIILSSDMNIYLETGRNDVVLNVFIDRSHFNKAFFIGMSPDDILLHFFERAIFQAKDGIMQFKILRPDHIHSIFQHMLIEMCNKDDHSDSIIRGYVRLLCMELNRASMIYSESIVDDWSDASNRLIQVFPSVLQYIRAHYANISLDDLADRFHYDSAYLSKMFKKLTGTNFMTILTQTRLDAAEHLLMATDTSASNIAKQVGYGSYDHFIRVFKKKHGISPAEYKRQNRLAQA